MKKETIRTKLSGHISNGRGFIFQGKEFSGCRYGDKTFDIHKVTNGKEVRAAFDINFDDVTEIRRVAIGDVIRMVVIASKEYEITEW